VRKNGFALRRSAWVVLALFCFAFAVQAGEKRAIVQGVSHANLRNGPGVSHPAKTILNENDQLIIEGKEGEWYFVTTVDGHKGYLHQSVMRVIGDDQPAAARDDVVATKPAGVDAEPSARFTPPNALLSAPGTASKTKSEPAPTDREPTASTAITAAGQLSSVADSNGSTTVEAKSPPLIHLLEGREGDIVLWLAIAVAFFFIGWICGGNYYLRRDRFRRTKLRF
jgi:hypothetical protein